MTFSLGTAVARPGEITYGEYDLIEHPISGQDRLPVTPALRAGAHLHCAQAQVSVARGKTHGPTFWITAAHRGARARAHRAASHPPTHHAGDGARSAWDDCGDPRAQPNRLADGETRTVLSRRLDHQPHARRRPLSAPSHFLDGHPRRQRNGGPYPDDYFKA